MAKRNAVLACAACLLLSACEYSPNTLDRAVAYNRTVANSSNQVLLLNIVRASQRLPTYYTRLEGEASSAGISPNGTLSLPLSNQHSFETDVTGASTATKAISSLGSIVGGLGVSASESNLLTLQTLDDQKYQNGMMTPVPLKNIQTFQEEGYPRDLLFMMFLGSVQVSQPLIDPIDVAIEAHCGQILRAANPVGIASFSRQACQYIQSRPYGQIFDPERARPANYSFSLRTCQQSGSAVTDDPPRTMVHFNNNPAREGRNGHPEICFQILLYDLLVLGLEVGQPQDAPAEVVDVVPDAVAQDAKFRTQMISQNLFVRPVSGALAAVCRKKNDAVGFTLTFAAPVASAAPLTNLMARLGAPDAATADKTAPPDDVQTTPQEACQQKPPGTPRAGRDLTLATPDDLETGPRGNAPRTVKLTSNHIAFSTRSFEGMIYYLGQAVRYEDDGNADPINLPRVLSRNPGLTGTGAYETLFYGTSHLPGDEIAVSVKDDNGRAYAIPKACHTGGSMSNCSLEYPDNESLQLLNFVNQVWGLQKESVLGPTSPLVVVSPQ